jgi:hypothetical protein
MEKLLLNDVLICVAEVVSLLGVVVIPVSISA